MSGNALQHATIFQTAGIALLAVGLCVIAYNFGQKIFMIFSILYAFNGWLFYCHDIQTWH
ncbi:MAG: hypothetical protein IPP49_06115 [Saprospiraceae bacterium]|nr:hypothetical protein [Saprospiraceae bacterium]